MEIKKEIKIIEQEITTYISEDGKIFSTKLDCLKYEEEVENKID